jgi:hypothetical protein
MSIRRTFLQVEELGQRVLPSISPLGLHGAPVVHHHAHHSSDHHHHGLHGIAVGGYTSTMQIPDTGTAYHLDGQGVFTTLGFATVTGDLHSVGFIAKGQATGTLTLTTAQGTVTLDLTGPTQSSFAPLPEQFTYQITAGTGAYANLQGQGTLDLHLVGSSATPGNPGQGVFTMRL